MIQLVVNVNLLREIDERKLINVYAKKLYNTEEDITNDVKIKENLEQLFNWDICGDNGMGVYCGKFESIKNKDWIKLINFIKDNGFEIKTLSSSQAKERRLNAVKVVLSQLEAKEKHNIERFTNENYTISGRGKKAKPCTYEGRIYKSQQECLYKEGLTKYKLYKYLKETNQI